MRGGRSWSVGGGEVDGWEEGDEGEELMEVLERTAGYRVDGVRRSVGGSREKRNNEREMRERDERERESGESKRVPFLALPSLPSSTKPPFPRTQIYRNQKNPPLFSSFHSLSFQQILPKQTHSFVEPNLLPKLKSLLLP